MRQAIDHLTVETDGKGLVEITRPVLSWVAAQGIGTGLLTLWCRHTSASLTVQENAAPAVRADIARFFEALAPEDATRYAHDD
jgi:secondary thiamine-phosphate synthase enzyme